MTRTKAHVDFRRGAVPFVGRDRTRTDVEFLAHAARILRLPTFTRGPEEGTQAFWLRHLEQLKFCSRHWAHVDLRALEQSDPALFVIAASQIATAAADMAQDVVVLDRRRNPHSEAT